MLRAAVVLAAFIAAPVRAGDVQSQLTADVVVDWSAAELRARGAAPADLRAPSPAVARTKALRLARRQARARLAKAIAQLPAAGGKQVGELNEAKLESVLDSATVVERSFGSDGSVRLTMAVGTEAVRAALAGPLAPGQSKIATLWIDARKQPLTPAVGIGVKVGAVSYQGPAVFFSSKKASKGDQRLAGPKGSKEARARSVEGGVVELEGIDAATLEAAAAGNVLLVFLIKKARTSR